MKTSDLHAVELRAIYRRVRRRFWIERTGEALVGLLVFVLGVASAGYWL